MIQQSMNRRGQSGSVDGVALPRGLVALIPVLAEWLSLLDEGEHMVLSVLGSHRYLQFAPVGMNLRAESVGNTYLYGHEELDADSLDWLAGHGWNDPDDAGNHWRHWEPADFRAAATVAAVTLHRVHGVVATHQLVAETSSQAVTDRMEQI